MSLIETSTCYLVAFYALHFPLPRVFPCPRAPPIHHYMKALVTTCTVDIDIVVCREEKFQAHVHPFNLMLTGILANVVVCDTCNLIYESNALHSHHRNEYKKHNT